MKVGFPYPWPLFHEHLARILQRWVLLLLLPSSCICGQHAAHTFTLLPCSVNSVCALSPSAVASIIDLICLRVSLFVLRNIPLHPVWFYLAEALKAIFQRAYSTQTVPIIRHCSGCICGHDCAAPPTRSKNLRGLMVLTHHASIVYLSDNLLDVV